MYTAPLFSEETDVAPATFCAQILDIATGEYTGPVPGWHLCTVHTGYSLRHHFVMQHPTNLMIIPKEGSMPISRCHLRGMQPPADDET